MKENTKDWIHYTSAVALIISSIVMAFVSFFMTEDIGPGPLTYIGEALSAALGLQNQFHQQKDGQSFQRITGQSQKGG